MRSCQAPSPFWKFGRRLNPRGCTLCYFQLEKVNKYDIWLLRNFVPTIDFTSSQFPAHEKRKYKYGIKNTAIGLTEESPKRWVPVIHSFLYKHKGKLGWSLICLRFSQFEPEIMLDGMLDLKTHFMVWYCVWYEHCNGLF